MKGLPIIPWLPALLATGVLLTACGGKEEKAAAAPSAPPVAVTLASAVARDFTVELEANGTVSALSSVDVKPQVSAQILQVHVREGQFVQAGQLLFTLDARADEARLKQAEAQFLKDEATLIDARRQLERNRELLARNFVSQGVVDTSQANVAAQQAVVAADRAAIEAVKVQLSFSRIVAPGGGRVGPIVVYPGSYVSPTGAAMLTITQIDPVAVAFTLPQRNLPDALQALAEGTGVVTATLPDGRGVRQGRLNFVDSTVDPESGTVKAKALFGNKDHALWPGAYVTVKMALQTLPGAIVVPHTAIVQGARGKVVFVAEPDNKAAMRPVEVLAGAGTEAVVSGIKAGDRVVVDGRQNLRPGASVVEAKAEPGTGTDASASGADNGATAPAGRGTPGS
jgi:RND family efflux transporter MFP subunit